MGIGKLSETVVRAILLDRDNYKVCAGRYNLSCHTIKRIRTGTTYQNVAPELDRVPSTASGSKAKRKFTDEQIKGILRDKGKLGEIAKKYSASKETIRAVLSGARYGDVDPKYPRRLKPIPITYCHGCIHFNGSIYRKGHRGPTVIHRCMLEIPEIRTSLGLKAATFCSCYMEDK